MNPSANRLGRLPRELQEQIFAHVAPSYSPHVAPNRSHLYYDARLLIRRARMMTVLCDGAPAPAVGRKRKLGNEWDARQQAACAWIRRVLPRTQQYILFGLREDSRVDSHFLCELGPGCLRIDRPWREDVDYDWCTLVCGGIEARNLRLRDGEWKGPSALFLGCRDDCNGRRPAFDYNPLHINRAVWTSLRATKLQRLL